jgi:DNA-binding transcriptional regulator YdaS (Cro superfamily)
MTPVEAFAEAIRRVATQEAFATGVGTSQQRISYLVTRKRPLPGELVIAAEHLTGVSRHDLRPDLYPHDAASSAPSPMGGVVTPSAPIVACDRSGILHSDAARG